MTPRIACLLAVALAGGAVAVSLAGVALAVSVSGYFAAYVGGHLLVNAMIGIAYAVIGGCVAWAAPRNPIGWLFILTGWCGGALTAIGEPYGLLSLRGDRLPLAGWVAWIGGWSWTVAFLLAPTVILTLWPSGRAPGRLRLLVGVSAARPARLPVASPCPGKAGGGDVMKAGSSLSGH